MEWWLIFVGVIVVGGVLLHRNQHWFDKVKHWLGLK